MKLSDSIKLAAEAVFNADALLFTSGAGMGVDSGLPDFRGTQGFWKAYPPIAKLGISFSDMANPRWFISNPKLAWAFYGHRLNLYRSTVPHEGFRMLLEMGGKKKNGYFVFTSNVDGQYHKAGFDDDRIAECHGSIHYLQSISPAPGEDHIWSAEGVEVIVDEEKFEAAEPLPMCPDGVSLARPNILMFGDWYWIPDRTNGQEANLGRWLRELINGKKKLTIIECGAGNAVATVRYKSETIAGNLNADLIRVNPRDHYVPRGGISIPMGAMEGIERIYKELK